MHKIDLKNILNMREWNRLLFSDIIAVNEKRERNRRKKNEMIINTFTDCETVQVDFGSERKTSLDAVHIMI